MQKVLEDLFFQFTLIEKHTQLYEGYDSRLDTPTGNMTGLRADWDQVIFPPFNVAYQALRSVELRTFSAALLNPRDLKKNKTYTS